MVEEICTGNIGYYLSRKWKPGLSKIAFAIIGSPNNSPHCPKGLFVVIIVECFSYLLFINWNALECHGKNFQDH